MVISTPLTVWVGPSLYSRHIKRLDRSRRMNSLSGLVLLFVCILLVLVGVSLIVRRVADASAEHQQRVERFLESAR